MRKRLVFLAAVLAAAACAISNDSGAKDNNAFNPRNCTRPISPNDPFQGVLVGDPLLATIANQCGNQAGSTLRGVDAVRARFYAGRANRMANNLDLAIRQLEGAAAVGSEYTQFGQPERRVVTLEMIHAYWQADRLEDAQARLDDALNRSRVLSSSDPAVAYQQAMLLLARSGLPARKEAFNTLQNWFPGDQASLTQAGLSAEDIQSARSWLFRLGSDLGRATLTDARDTAQRLADARDGVTYFGAAARTVEVACPRPRVAADPCLGIKQPETPRAGIDSTTPAQPLSTDIENAFFGLGISHLRAAGVADADSTHLSEPGGLDCLGGNLQSDAVPHINEAGRAFQTIQFYYADSPAPANWGLGCTMLAGLGNSNMSAQLLQRAIDLLKDPPPTTVNMLLTLAHAQVMQNNRGEARTNLSRALGMPGVDNELRGRIQVDIARTYYYQSLSGQRADPDLYARTITDVDAARLNDLQQPEVTSWLQQAARADNVEAQLVLAQISLREGRYDAACTRLRTIVASDPRADSRVGAAPYLLSQCLTLKEQSELAAGRHAPRVVRPSEAVRAAIAAYQLQNAHAVDYRQQVCVAQITFGDVRNEGFCASGANPDPESLLNEGMYWLRRAIGERRGPREPSFTRAMAAFVQGSTVSGNRTHDFLDLRNQQSQLISLDSLHRYGQNFVQWCVGLHFTQNDEASKQMFLQAGMPDCP